MMSTGNESYINKVKELQERTRHQAVLDKIINETIVERTASHETSEKGSRLLLKQF